MPIIVDNKIIDTPVRDILDFLKQQLYVSHIDKLDTIDYKLNNARVKCPMHGGGQERTPSCDILLHDKGITPAGTVHCFGCGYRANIVKFIADCLEISYRSAKEWLLNSTQYSYLEDVRDVDVDIVKEESDVFRNWPKVSIDELKQYDYIHPYMFKRKLTDQIIDRFEVGYDRVANALTFPVYVKGECLFVAKRAVNQKRFIMPSINPKPIYALDYIKGDSVIVCESVINCLTCFGYGYDAIALFGTGSAYQYDELKKSNIRAYYLAFDGDEAGLNAIKRFVKQLSDRALIYVMNIPKGKDINDLTKEEFDKILLDSENNFV